MKNHVWKIVIAVIILVLGGSIVYSNYAAKQADEGVAAPEAHVKGNPDASIVLVEYSDFECPACGQFYPHVKEVMETHGEHIRFEYRHFPLINIHAYAMPAAIAAEAAGQQGKFFEMHDKLFENQSVWSKSGAPQPYFEQYASEIGLDVATFKRHLGSSIIRDAVEKSFDDARNRGFTGTPTFLLNDEVMEFETFGEFKDRIAQAVGEATGEPVATSTATTTLETN